MFNLNNKFKEVVLTVTGKDINKHDKAARDGECALKCDDQFVATIEITNSKISFIDNDILSTSREDRQEFYKNQAIDTIALVLESPHKKEFENSSCGPAKGAAGENISDILLGNLAKFRFINDIQNEGAYFKTSIDLREGKYKLLLINAVQYQCSLGDLTGKGKKEQRDKIFRAFFIREAQDDFIERLRRHNPKIIINCCTGGHYMKVDGLQKMVQEVIDRENFSAVKLIGSHPASAFFARGFCNA